MNAYSQALADIDAATDPNSERNQKLAHVYRQRARTDRRAFINDAVKRWNCGRYVMRWLSSGFGYEFLTFDEAVAALRRQIRICRANARKGRAYQFSSTDMRHRLVVARYFALHARALLAQDVREVA